MSTTQKPDPPATPLTGYTERPPQASGVFLALLELHAAHSDDLTHQEEPLPHQVAAAQVLETQTSDGDHLHQTEPVIKVRSHSSGMRALPRYGGQTFFNFQGAFRETFHKRGDNCLLRHRFQADRFNLQQPVGIHSP